MRSVSVIIPCYRYGRYLPQCVASVLGQPGVETRVLVLDDASPDDTPAVAEALAAAEPRLTFRGHAANQGHLAIFNEGLAWADGDFTVLLSADDWLAPGSLARAAQLLDAHPEVGLVCGGAVRYTDGDPPPAPGAADSPARWRIIAGRAWIATACRAAHVPIYSPEVVMRTATLRAVGVFDTALPHTADLHLWLRFGLRGAVGQIQDTTQAYYRLHPANMHKELAPTRRHDLQHRLAAFQAFFAAHAHELAGPGRLERAAARRLAREALLEAASQPEADGTALARFAFQVHPAAALTPEYWGWQARRRLGPRALPFMRQVARRFFRL